MNRFGGWIPPAAVLLALGFRAVYFAQIRANPYFDAPIMDEGYHDLWAREIAAGDLGGQLPFFRAPLYPFLLGAAYRLFGPDFDVIRGIQLALGAVTPWLTWAIARRLFPSALRLAGVAAFVVALDGMLLYFEGDLLLESLLAPLGALFALALLRAFEVPRVGRWFAAGLVLGAFAITRPNILLYAPVAFVFALGPLATRSKWRTGAALALTAGTCVLVFPVTAANWIGGGDRVLVASQAGLNFFLGNNEEANGWSATAPSLFRIDWWGGYEDSITRAEEAEGRELRPSEVSRHWFGEAFAWWARHPGDALVLTCKKAVFFLSGKEFGNNRDVYLFLREFAPVALPSAYLLYALMPLAWIGAFFVWRAGRGGKALVLFVVVYGLSVIFFFVTARYRVPLRPLLVIFALVGATELFRLFRARPRFAGALLAALVVASAAVNANPWMAEYQPSQAQFYQSVANVHHEKGELLEALHLQQRALELDSTYPKGNLNLGALYLSLGNPEAAIPAFERERELDPEDGENLASLAQAYQRTGRLREAERTYEAAEEAGLSDARALYNHGVCLERLEQPEEAELRYRRAVEADPGFADAWNNLGVLRARAGELDEAIRYWEKTLEVKPGDPRALDNLQRARRMLVEENEAE